MFSNHVYCALTGPNKFLYFRIEESFCEIDPFQNSINTNTGYQPEAVGTYGQQISENYTCHMWAMDTGSLVVCTDLGDILIMDFQGGFK